MSKRMTTCTCLLIQLYAYLSMASAEKKSWCGKIASRNFRVFPWLALLTFPDVRSWVVVIWPLLFPPNAIK
ncbi:hypothetical protein H4582DRAFT_2017554 [Lactarius indigo]|nr:hypothetical protein H4582DRAFT_2017554 [Lactarius indigo]